MNNGLILKVYDIDYSFIIKNYLNPEMWQKTWTIFQYKTFVVTLNIDYINCQKESITFDIKIKDNSIENKYMYEWGKNSDKEATDNAYYSLKINDLDFLKKIIESSVLKTIEKLEEYNIMASKDYLDLQELYSNEQDLLREIAENFLDVNNVQNEEVREAYIDNYISNNTKADNYLRDMKSQKKYSIFSDLYLVFANATNNKNTIETWEKLLAKNNNIEELKSEIKEYLEYMETKDFENEMNDKLEEI